MNNFWIANKPQYIATDIQRLATYVDKFDAPYVEVNFNKRLLNIQQRWCLYRDPATTVLAKRTLVNVNGPSETNSSEES
ncbi:hypothetical protein [Aliidiomarina shirensis]|uniref:hypothetical protein n=1 Tax=Aliidiomarina shirensis TaxID=1048642 RepID=UPI001300A05F|nr:hypothetical protein [Aliidiomarina shirensis]